jgi:hypothetical protein
MYIQSQLASRRIVNVHLKELLDHVSTNNPTALTRQVEAATIKAAKIGGTMKSILDLTNKCEGKQRISPGTSNGILMNPSFLHFWENKEAGDMAETNVTCGEIDATATVNVNSIIQVVA